MDSTQAPEKKRRDESGIALFMVVAAMSVLSVLVTEFTYVAQVNQRMAYDGLDQLKALYLAKSGFKLSLLRLKAYQQVKGFISSSGGSGGAIPGLSKKMIDRIWSFPFFYPFPTNIPGMTTADKDRITEFEKSSGLEGSYTAVIESESSKYNLNTILAPFAPTATPSTTPSTTPSPIPTEFSADAARQSLHDYLGQILDQKLETDEVFADTYRDLKLEELMDSIIGWADKSYESHIPSNRQTMAQKRAPFYSLSEMHMIPYMDDQLYELFAPSLTASTTPGINVNTMKEPTLKALIPSMTKEEIEAFFEFRDSETEDNDFKTAEDFFKYLQDKVAAYKGREDAIRQLQQDLAKRNIRIIVDEQNFKITVQAKVNQATKILEAWVTLEDNTKKDSLKNNAKKKSGLKVTFMRII
jgi:general secretion pathway protein K